MDNFSFHRRFLRYAGMHRGSLAGKLYGHFGDFDHGFRPRHINNAVRGVVDSVLPNGLVIKNEQGELVKILVDDMAKLSSQIESFVVGDWVVVFGPKRENTIKAFGVRKLPIPTELPEE